MGFWKRFTFNPNIFRLNIKNLEGHSTGHLRFFLSLAAAIMIFAGLMAVIVFFIALKGEDQTMVPDVRGKDLVDALLELQVKELYPRIQQRYSEPDQERGLVLEQNPPGGTIVKAGRRIRLVVSQGAVVNSVENYIGRNVDDVRMDLRALFASSSQPLLSIKEPVMYQYAGESAGTILQQSPLPGTPISQPVVLELVVSRGPEQTLLPVPDLMGLSLEKALENLASSGLRFSFTLRPSELGERGETVVAQNPPAATMLDLRRELSITITEPVNPPRGEVFGLFSRKLPENAYPMPVLVEALLPSGEQRLLITLEHPGGDFSIPYRLPAGSVIILYVLNREMAREEVRPPMDILSLDQL